MRRGGWLAYIERGVSVCDPCLKGGHVGTSSGWVLGTVGYRLVRPCSVLCVEGGYDTWYAT
jgi:hypothetical protein